MSKNYSDEFYTKRETMEPILKYLKPNSTIWCPADEKDSNIVKALEEAGHIVIHTHIDKNQDFLTSKISDGNEWIWFKNPNAYVYLQHRKIDYIITNPPYSIRNDWFKKTMEFNIPFALLIPTLYTQWTTYLNNSEEIEIMYFQKRQTYITEQKTQPTATAWFCKGILPKQIMLVRKEKNNEK